ncbi:transcriptional regulator [Natronococcus wangiae]|uniref:transcriptional regulator n=1 Tax=Natronococcus wangiae TaxID=3068275 RepID=UPI00273DA869|nr:transcriptional regulator [Natronococcus sp. AD5]
MLDVVEQQIDEGEFTNQSEFQRFAVEYLLTQLEDEYDPTLAEFDEIKQDALGTANPEAAEYIQTAESGDFLGTAGRVRQCAVRGDIETARELIDTRYAPDSPRAMILDLIVQGAATTQLRTATPDE